METTYKEIFSKKFKKCKSKKDYKRLCHEMLTQLDVIDKVEDNQYKIMAYLIGEDAYSRVLALSIKMYLLERQGIPCDVLTIEDYDI